MEKPLREQVERQGPQVLGSHEANLDTQSAGSHFGIHKSMAVRSKEISCTPIRTPLIPSRSFASKTRQRWRLLSRRTKVITVVTIMLVFLTILLGAILGATLGHAVPVAAGATHQGDLTYYDVALGACGITSSANEMVAAVSHQMYDKVQVGGNPNTNPLCGKRLRVKGPLGSVDVKVVDRCTGCKFYDVDLSTGAYDRVGQQVAGRVPGTWQWIDQVPAGAN